LACIIYQNWLHNPKLLKLLNQSNWHFFKKTSNPSIIRIETRLTTIICLEKLHFVKNASTIIIKEHYENQLLDAFYLFSRDYVFETRRINSIFIHNIMFQQEVFDDGFNVDQATLSQLSLRAWSHEKAQLFIIKYMILIFSEGILIKKLFYY